MEASPKGFEFQLFRKHPAPAVQPYDSFVSSRSGRGRRRRDDEKGREFIRFAGAQELDCNMALPIPPFVCDDAGHPTKFPGTNVRTTANTLENTNTP
ncbi:hypothetical protein KC19_3G001600 [Ceratodon purpureus]|uniref:Uncharacterized protein n=1 Tax=Ceratodon purpureus TaxID=3225 RepID=A0A8T0IGW9_CERPU|nr:hypothetical protein KC19_3G001600 [Ceratodon purpureus]